MPSTVIRHFSYDDETQTLFVTFVDGDIYAYQPVPRAVHRAFQDAISKGRFFSRRIRGRYAFAKLTSVAGTDGAAARSTDNGRAGRGRSIRERTRP